MSLERPFFQSFVEGDGDAFDRYISEKRRDGSWGDEPEIQALCELYDRPCEVWAYDAGMDPRKGGGARILRTFHAAAKGGSVMRLSYYGGGHYDSLVNDSDEFDPLADPGSCELLALQKARARKTNADASSALAVSDAEATERAAVEQALSASRAAYDGAADLEAALQASLSAQREAETSDLQSELDAAALRRAEDDDLARAIALSSDAAPQQGDADLAAAIDLSRGRRRGGRRPPRAGAGGVDRGLGPVAPSPHALRLAAEPDYQGWRSRRRAAGAVWSVRARARAAHTRAS